MTAVLITTIKCLAAILLGVIEGNGSVHFINRMPPRWLCDYGEEPSPELLDSRSERVKSTPWKFILSMLFVALNIKLVIDDWMFALPASAALFFLAVLSMADIRYRILPDQVIILLAVTGMGLIPYHGSWKACLLGTAIGFFGMGAVALIGKLAARRETIGGGDIKLFTALGFLAGPSGIILIFMATAFLSAAHFAILLATGRKKRADYLPMAPYIAICTAAYLVFFWGLGRELIL